MGQDPASEPSREWLEHAHTPVARIAITRWLAAHPRRDREAPEAPRPEPAAVRRRARRRGPAAGGRRGGDVRQPGATVRLAGCCTPVPPDERHRIRRARRSGDRSPRRVPGGGAHEGRSGARRSACAGGTPPSAGSRSSPNRSVAPTCSPTSPRPWPWRARRSSRRPSNRPPSSAYATPTRQLPDAAQLPGLMRAMRNVAGVYDVSRAQQRRRPGGRPCPSRRPTPLQPTGLPVRVVPARVVAASHARADSRGPCCSPPAPRLATSPWRSRPRIPPTGHGVALSPPPPPSASSPRAPRARTPWASATSSSRTWATPGYDVASYDLSFTYTGSNSKPLQAVTTIDAWTTDRPGARQSRLRPREGASPSRSTGAPATFRSAGEDLVVTPEEPLPDGELDADHRAAHQRSRVGEDRDGGWVRTSDGLAMANQADAAHLVFPCNDHPSDKAMFTIRVTAPNGLHGRRQRPADGRGPRGRRRPPGRTAPEHPMATELAQVSIGRSTVAAPHRPARAARTRRRAHQGPRAARTVAEEDAGPDRLDGEQGRALPLRDVRPAHGRGLHRLRTGDPDALSLREDLFTQPATRSGTSSRSWCTSWRTSGSGTA